MSWNGLAQSVPSGGIMPEIEQSGLLASIAAVSDDCILSLDKRGAIRWASPATEQVLGWRPEELAGGVLDELFPSEGGDIRAAAIRRLLAGERVQPFVETGLRRDGSSFMAQVTLGPVHEPDGSVGGAVVILRDVTGQLREQRELALALEMSRAHFDQAIIPQAIFDVHGQLDSANPAWCELFGRGEGWFADSNITQLMHPDDVPAFAATLLRLRGGGVESVSFRGRFRDADDEDMALVLDAALLREPNGRPYAVAASVREPGPGDDPQTLGEALRRRGWDTACVVDEDLVLTHVTPALDQLLGYDSTGDDVHLTWEYVHPTDVPVVVDLLARLIAEPHRQDRAVLRLRDRDQQWRWVEITAANCLADPEIGGIVANVRDVTEQVKTEEALRLSEAMHRAMVETAPEGILATSPEGTVIFANETAAEILGRPVADMYGATPLDLFGFADDAADVQVHDVVHERPDGSERTLEVSRRPLNSRNNRLGSLLTMSDVTESRQAERALLRRALHDPLTALPNRYLFLDRLETAAARQRRYDGRETAVLYLDLDEFKQINDTYGHEAGDGVLREVAARLLASVRATDTVGRLGGDEFAVICEDSGVEPALIVAHRILDAFSTPVRIDGADHEIGVSIGVALAPQFSFDVVVRRADEAMYLAKQRGGRRIVVAGAEDD